MDIAHSSSKGGIARRCTRPIAGGAQNKLYARLELTIPNQSFQYRTAARRAVIWPTCHIVSVPTVRVSRRGLVIAPVVPAKQASQPALGRLLAAWCQS